jgi:trans-aconitate methyltransferase
MRQDAMKNYQWNANDYAKHSGAQLNWARELLAKLHLQGQERVLDIGCGEGKITVEIAQAVPKGSVLGIDSSAVMVRSAQECFSNTQVCNLLFMECDARQMKFAGEFDVVFSNAALHWIIDHRPVVLGIQHALKKKGKLLLQMGGKGNAADILDVFDDVLRQPAWAAYFEGFTFPYGFYAPEQYEQWLSQAGLVPLRLELIPKVMVQPNAEALKGWIRTTWLPYTQRLPEDKQEIFIQEIAERYVGKMPPNVQGEIQVNMVRLEIEAIKE